MAADFRLPRQKVKDRILQSPAKIVGHGTHFRSEDWLNRVTFSDIMDVVLYMIDFDGQRDLITRIETHKFWKMVEEMWKEDEWQEKFKRVWGWRRYEYPIGSGKYHRYYKRYDLDSAWHNGSGPLGGTMGAAEQYALLYPGFRQHRFLILFFSYPSGLPMEGGNWPTYKKLRVEEGVFSKLRQPRHAKKLECILDFADAACDKLRGEALKRA